ncbi:MAG: hypothetical protein NXY57DRAFT_890544 [Lentinula lateritia]|uniref:Cyclin N-terminal domain-containing protein n=1 Tax=Lentinula lateritia TaxID=40482 RepID=A0ABQ8VUA1_9AGAR|nr:MAG: hypothetical protein NXY57DRAFT_890544 [Lentinula lateritia]KAJ4499957.1 hypothetical protein C8R41DRAFT_752950 [Lentinula lateritia]
MPVPVPHHSKQPAHLVIKQHCSDDGVNHSFQDLTGILPASPTGPPPSFGTREQWINSLPSWRRSKPRRIWEDDSHPFTEQDFQTGLARADNASAIKGSRAKACPPPFYIQHSTIAPTIKGAATSIDMVPHGPFDTAGMHANDKACSIATNMEIDVYDNPDRGAFTPIFEDDSPEFRSLHEVSSSPVEPVTPFGDFVDRAVSSTSAALSCSYVSNASLAGAAKDTFQLQCYRSHPATQPFTDLPVSVSAPELVTPTATSGYRKLSEPLSEWIAHFVWKACTTGTNIPSSIAQVRLVTPKAYAMDPPSYLATSIHSLLLSTLLQPSAIFLALWYIVRLPVSFGTVSMTADHTKELRFRMVLLGENHRLNQDVTDNTAPFRLIVLGCMLANKWLDDHTFSNKTWHSISNVPIKILNELESLALDIFAYDLSISTADWSDWLLHVMSYHLSLSSPSHPQPISRPSANPHLIIKFALEEIINAPKAYDSNSAQPRAVFLGLEERRREKQEKEQAQKANVLEIDLDEDGPLREEYMPKRRVSEAGAPHSVENSFSTQRQIWETNKSAEKQLPPPARWSPAGDEPILRDSNRPHGRYLAVQPTPGVLVPVTSYQGLPQYQSTHEFNYVSQPWLPNVQFATAKPLPTAGHFLEFTSHQHPAHSVFNSCPPPLLLPFALPHSRSQSYSHDQDTSQSYNHTRSYSQSQFEYRCCDLCMTPNELPPVQADVDMTWGLSGRHSYGPPAFAPHPSVTYQSTWLRT